jgi:hypothetical protein
MVRSGIKNFKATWKGRGEGGGGLRAVTKKLRCGLRAKIHIRDFLNTKQDNVQTATSELLHYSNAHITWTCSTPTEQKRLHPNSSLRSHLVWRNFAFQQLVWTAFSFAKRHYVCSTPSVIRDVLTSRIILQLLHIRLLSFIRWYSFRWSNNSNPLRAHYVLPSSNDPNLSACLANILLKSNKN